MMSSTATTPSAEALLGMKPTNPIALHEKLLAGLPFKALTKFLETSELDPKDVYAVMKLPARTLARRKMAGKLSAEESDHLLRLADLYRQTVGFFNGNAEAARGWLAEKRPALGGHRPIDLARTASGMIRVTTLIFQLENGVFV